MHRQTRNRKRPQTRAVPASARRQSALLGVVITILMALLLFMWAQQARAAIGDAAITAGQAEETLDMAKSPREVFVGRWYGEDMEAGSITKRWLVDAFPDGVFRITFRFYEDDGGYREQIEVGEWGISGPVYFLSTKGWVDDGMFLKADTSNGQLYDAYKILKLEQQVFEYEHFVNGNRYQVRRVDTGFTLPE
ncbi:hypothetical protein AAFN88_10980 [Pelagibius sp. CAU 1746]|uniref:hypothetical protein n=1 Tax=Pelagibius sp. CAU 1746 TaxID=3140370 RepID=UPI00325AEF76